jgi:CheY-like chemotaxis protein
MPAIERPAPTAGTTVLVVDDDATLRETLRVVLEDEGYAVVTAENGAAALAALPGLPRPFTVLLDLMMPVMSGWELLARLREIGALNEVTVLVMTASREPAPPPGAAAWLRKPMELAELLETVKLLCA